MRVPAQRPTVSYIDKSRDQFRVSGTPLTQQFANLYFTRLGELRPSIEQAIRLKWGSESLQQCVKTLDAEPEVPVVVIGTVYVEMKRKPNILEEVTRDVLEVREHAQEESSKYCSQDDAFLLEDESGRLVLTGAALATTRLVTGAVIAVRGCVKPSGELEIADICFPGLAPQSPIGAADEPDRYVALVSGLHIGDGRKDMLPLQMLLEHLTGQLGCAEVSDTRSRTTGPSSQPRAEKHLILHSPRTGPLATSECGETDHCWQCHQQPC